MTTTEQIIEIKKTSYPVIWTEFKDFPARHVEGSPLFAIPCDGKKSCRRYAVIDERDLTDYVCQLNKKEVDYWLMQDYRNQLIMPIEEAEEQKQIAGFEVEEQRKATEHEQMSLL